MGMGMGAEGVACDGLGQTLGNGHDIALFGVTETVQ